MALKSYGLLAFIVFLTTALPAQWTPGQVYREYVWTTPADHDEPFLRVGGRYGYAARPGKLPASLQDGSDLLLPDTLALAGAIRAEVVVEKVMSHEDTRNLRIVFNGQRELPFPEPATVPAPQTEYMYHTSVVAPVPLTDLRPHGNRFRLRVDSIQRWNWPQNLVYAVILRVYYAPEADPPMVSIMLGRTFEGVLLSSGGGPVNCYQHVDFVFDGRAPDWSGRGTYDRVHWQTFRGQPHNILGRSVVCPPQPGLILSDPWLPAQTDAHVRARVLRYDGSYLVHAPSDPFTVNSGVTLYEPGPAPRNWVTRSGKFEQTIPVPDTVTDATAYRLLWTSWSPCYGNGLFLNDHLVWSRTDDDCYRFAAHQPEFSGHALPYLQRGDNVVRTALTPPMRGRMVHGMEVQWPGVQLLVRRPRDIYRPLFE